MQGPLVSVLMTAYNRENYIVEAIESVLSSTYPYFELIVVDDCSQDNTVEIARSYGRKDERVRVYVNEKNLGDYPNRNRAASYATGKYIKYLDSDDVMYPHCLQVMVGCMERFPHAGYGLSSHGDPHRPYPVCISPVETYRESFDDYYGHFNRAPGSAIMKRDAFNQVGGFSGERMIGDYKLWLTLSRMFDLVKMPRDLVWDRTHDGQERNSPYAKKYDELRSQVLKEALAHPDCPLDELTRQRILNQNLSKRIKRKILSWV